MYPLSSYFDTVFFCCCISSSLLDTQFLSTIRSTKISLVKSKFRRQLSHSRKLSHVASMYHSQNEATLDLIRAARKDAKAASAVVLAMSGELNKVRKTRYNSVSCNWIVSVFFY